MRSEVFVGLTLKEAQTFAAENGLRIEVLEGTIIDLMADPGRVRVRVTDGVITEATGQEINDAGGDADRG